MEAKIANITVQKTARYATLGEDITKAERIWFVCHGYGMQAQYFIRKFGGLDMRRNFIIAPEGLHRFYLEGFTGRVGATWMTKEARLDDIDDYIRYLDALHEALGLDALDKGQQLFHFGFSQGVATISRYIAMGRHRAHKAVFWAGTFPPDLNPVQCRQAFEGLPVYTAMGDSDPFSKELHRQNNTRHFEAMGIIPTHMDFQGGHDILPDSLRKIEILLTE